MPISASASESTAKVPSIVVQPDFLESVERLENYKRGGYHPVNLGDVLNKIYRIRCKLGFGMYATVWLAHDEQKDEYVAIKIISANASLSYGCMELDFLRTTTGFSSLHHDPNNSRIIRLIDHFVLDGPHGHHLCIVTEVLAESLYSLMDRSSLGTLHPAVAKHVTKQILQGLDLLHDLNIVHYDLKLDNVLVELPDMQNYIRRSLESFSPEIYPPVKTENGLTINYVPSTPIAIPLEDIRSFKLLDVKIADLGVACFEWRANDFVLQAPTLRAPEIFLGYDRDTKCDIWSIGCILFQMLTGHSPTPSANMETLGARILFLERLFGPFPQELISYGEYAEFYFKEDGSFLYDFPESARVPRFTAWLEGYEGVLHPDEIKRTISFLEAAFTLLPEDRPTAAELLEFDWISSEVVLCDATS